jgi:IPT/TIG domain-containing protein
MRSSSLARVVMASLGVSVVITLGCGTSPGPRPSPQPSLNSVLSISPTEGPIVGATVARIGGTGFQAGATVTVDGVRVDATVLSATTISLTMPAHAPGKVNVTVINPLSQAQASVPGGYIYVGPPVISELLPNIGSTGGGTPIVIRGTGTGTMGAVVTVTVDGIIVSIDDSGWPYYEEMWLSMPAHAAGTVEVIVTDRYGQTGSGVFTYASPATFDFNGDWEGLAYLAVGPEWGARLMLTIRDNIVVSVLCSVCRDGICAIGSTPSLTLDPAPVVANGEFSYAGSGGSITGNILSATYATGSLNLASCGSRQWTAQKKR